MPKAEVCFEYTDTVQKKKGQVERRWDLDLNWNES